MKVFFLALVITVFSFAQEKPTNQDSTDLANISNAYQKTWQDVQQLTKQFEEIDYAVAKGKARLFDLQNAYNEKLKAIEDKKKKVVK